MIDPKEVRIGNLVKYNNRVFQIDTISTEFPTLDTPEFGIGVVDWERLEGVRITEEWLLKLGYNHCTITANHFTFNGHRIWNCNGMFICDKNGTIIRYLHDLQNLYFAISGKELAYQSAEI